MKILNKKILPKTNVSFIMVMQMTKYKVHGSNFKFKWTIVILIFNLLKCFNKIFTLIGVLFPPHSSVYNL